MHSEVGNDPQSLTYGFVNEILDHPSWNGGPGICRMGCTKFNEGCTKFCEGWCTKSPKMHSEAGIRPKSLFYGFINEMMAHPCSDGGPGITRLGCTKFNEGCTKFCEGCTNGLKVRSWFMPSWCLSWFVSSWCSLIEGVVNKIYNLLHHILG